MSLSLSSMAQSAGELSVKSGFWSGPQIYQSDMKIDKKEVSTIMAISPEALALYDKGKSQLSQSNILGLLGGVSLGYGLGPNNDNELAFLGVGLLGAIGAGIMFGKGKDNLESAVDLYNSEYDVGYGTIPKPTYSVSLTATGSGIAIGIAF